MKSLLYLSSVRFLCVVVSVSGLADPVSIHFGHVAVVVFSLSLSLTGVPGRLFFVFFN